MRDSKRIFVFVMTTVAFLSFFCIRANAQISSGYISNSFPNDFPTAVTLPTNIPYGSISSYLPEGQIAPMNVHFYSYSASTGSVTIEASCDAFVSNMNQTLRVSQSNENFNFVLTPTIKSGIDGTYTINFIAVNELSAQFAQTQTTIIVFSTSHQEAANMLYTASALTYGYVYGIGIYTSNNYQSPQAKANRTLAIIELASAEVSYNEKDWNGTQTHAQNSINLVKQADTAESESDLQGKTAYLIQVITYPSLIIIILAILYVIAAIYRKIYPSTKTPSRADKDGNAILHS